MSIASSLAVAFSLNDRSYFGEQHPTLHIYIMKTLPMLLNDRSTLPSRGQKVLCFSPTYQEGNAMRWRVMDGEFVEMCEEVEGWMSCEDLNE